MEELEVFVTRAEGVPLPDYRTVASSGMDLRAHLDAPVILKPLERALIPTGIRIAMPDGHEAQVRPRSGLAIRYGITLLNTPGTIDSDYRGEIGIIMINHGQEPFEVRRGDRIAQMTVHRVCRVSWYSTASLQPTARGDGGFGHTG